VQKLLCFVVRLDLIEGHSIRLYRALRHAKHIEDAGSDTTNSSTYSMHKFLTTQSSSRSFILERPYASSHVKLEVAQYVEKLRLDVQPLGTEVETQRRSDHSHEDLCSLSIYEYMTFNEKSSISV
jgi:hypothetical protein